MTDFIFRFLGTYQVSADAIPVTDFHSDKARALLAYLVLEPREHARATLAALLWPEIGDEYACANCYIKSWALNPPTRRWRWHGRSRGVRLVRDRMTG